MLAHQRGEQSFSLCRTPPIAQLLSLEATVRIHADDAAGVQRSLSGPGMGQFCNDRLVLRKSEVVSGWDVINPDSLPKIYP